MAINIISKLIILCVLMEITNEIYADCIGNRSQHQLDKISLNGKWFIDGTGRVKLFHGINAVKKSFPWIPNIAYIDMTNNTQLLNLKKWGFNVVRLGIMWSGLMPTKNFINQTYLDEMTQIVNNLALYGIYSIIDLHQDVMSSEFGTYDAVPKWILDELPKSKFSFPWPLNNKTITQSVFSGYLTEACGFAFQSLYENRNNFETYFNEYWTIIAKNFANNTAILGYELINEPWAGDIFANPFLLLPTVAGQDNLLPFYDRVYKTIRKYDSETLIFYEPVTWGILSNKRYLGTGFNRAPGNDVNKTVFSWHYYCWLLALDQNPIKNGTYPIFDKVICDQLQLKDAHEVVKQDMNNIGNGASFLTEFGVCAFSDPIEKDRFNQNTYECESILNANDKYITSWTYWDSNFYNVENDFKVNENLINIFSRIYPISTNGFPNELYYNTTSKVFYYSFNVNGDSLEKLLQSTEIFIPEHVYPKGFKVTLSANYKWTFDLNTRILSVKLIEENKKKSFYYKNHSSTIMIKINPNL